MFAVEKMIKKKLTGSYTVEMSVIMPLIIITTWLLIFAALYIYDCSSLECQMIDSLYNYDIDNNRFISDGEVEEKIAEYFNNKSNNLLAKWDKSVEVSVEENRRIIFIEAYMNNAWSALLPGFDIKLWKYRGSYYRSILNERKAVLTL